MENIDTALVSGAAILLSFVAGYKYAEMVQEKGKKPKVKEHRVSMPAKFSSSKWHIITFNCIFPVTTRRV